MKYVGLLTLVLSCSGVGCTADTHAVSPDWSLYQQTLDDIRLLGEKPEATLLAETLNSAYRRAHAASVDAGTSGLGAECTSHSLASQINALIPLTEAIAQGRIVRSDGAHMHALHDSIQQLVDYIQECVE